MMAFAIQAAVSAAVAAIPRTMTLPLFILNSSPDGPFGTPSFAPLETNSASPNLNAELTHVPIWPRTHEAMARHAASHDRQSGGVVIEQVGDAIFVKAR